MKRTHSQKRQTVPFTCHVTPQTKAEAQRMAQAEGISASQIGRAFIEEGIRQKLHIQHAVLLQPIIKAAIREEMAKFSNRIALLIVRVAFDTSVIRSLTRNILGRQPGVTPKILNDILDKSGESAKNNITRRTPQLQTVLDKITQWFTGEEREAETQC